MISQTDTANWLKPHAASWMGKTRPPIEALSRWISGQETPDDHWAWSEAPDAKYSRRFNDRKQAVISWTSGPQFRRGLFVVVRVLLEAQEVDVTPRVRFALSCGIPQCVNPSHWRRVDPPCLWRMQALDSGVWQLVRVVSGAPAQRELVVQARLAGVVHLVAIAPLDRRSLAAPRAVCGVELPPALIAVTTSPVTCAGCR